VSAEPTAEHGLVCLRRFAVGGMPSRPARKTKVTYLCGPRPAVRVSPSPTQGQDGGEIPGTVPTRQQWGKIRNNEVDDQR
jgi:hypothetical protein